MGLGSPSDAARIKKDKHVISRKSSGDAGNCTDGVDHPYMRREPNR